jgi:Cu(I)/Ag(I) efflux system membrane protein CusA/SilA
MIDRILEFSVRNRLPVIAVAVALAAGCVLAVYHTPVDAIPDLSENQVIVFTEWAGHSPHEVEDQVTYPLSLSLQGLSGVRVVRSSSDVNFSMISVIFEDGVDLTAARQELAERLAAAGGSLPAGVTPQLAPDALATGQIYWYTVEGAGQDPGRLRAIQDWYVRPQLQSVPGVAEVATVGGYPTEYQVEVDPYRLRAHRVSLADVLEAVARSNGAVGGHVVEKGNAEYLVRGAGLLGHGPDGRFDRQRALRDLEQAAFPRRGGTPLCVGDVATVTLGAGFRRGVLEKDGAEATGGVVLMRRGENPLEVTRRIKHKIGELAPGLPDGVRIVPFYDRTPLIEGAVGTVTRTLVEAMITAAVCVLLVLLHFRTSFIIALVLPLAAATPFGVLWVLRRLGVVDVPTNIMSLAGIAISIGVLVDSSVVLAENAMHHLKRHFGDRPVRGDVRGIVLAASREVGRPLFFSVVIMLLSFLPVFAWGGMEGKMFRPLAFTKSFALLAAALLTITLVPALCTIFIRGRLRSEQDSWLVRSVTDVYRPVLGYLLARPGALVWFLGATCVVGLAPLGSRWIFLTVLFLALVGSGLTVQGWPARVGAMASLVLIALVAGQLIQPLGREFMTPLDEGMVMDMPITVPRASVTQSGDDLKARDMVLCTFPEVEMVVGKAGRAETPSDPAPLDMIETMVNFRPREFWPRRKLRHTEAERQAEVVYLALLERGLIEAPGDEAARGALVEEAVQAAMPTFDAQMRGYAAGRNRELEREIGPQGHESLTPHHERLWREHVAAVDGELLRRGAAVYTRLILEELLLRAPTANTQALAAVRDRRALRAQPPEAGAAHAAGHHHHGASTDTPPPAYRISPALEVLHRDLTHDFEGRIALVRMGREELAGFGGELDRAVQMPGWTNVWTMPIQNRVDMLATGVNTAVGVRVLGGKLEDVVQTSEAIAAVLRRVRGAADVVADPVRGKGYLEIVPDRERVRRFGLSAGDINDVVETALGGKVATMTVEGRERHPVRVRCARAWREDEETVKNLPVAAAGAGWPSGRLLALSEVADVRVAEGPATIKSENCLLRNYVRLNVRDRDLADFVEEARQTVARAVALPSGVYVEWTGQFEHEVRARKTLMFILPLVVALIGLVLYLTYRDLADVALILLAVPGAVAGGMLLQWWFGYKFSVTVWVGYIACFGMATSTGIVMLVYLRQAVAKAGGLGALTPEQLRQAVLDGAVQRLRPKLLTEGTTILGLAPVLWATGVGAEVIKPMAVPVLGGLLIADEVIDLFLPVLFYRVRRRRWERLQSTRA